MENLAIDENNRATGGGMVQGTRQTLPLFVNASGELLIEIIPVAVAGTVLPAQNLPIDENNRNCAGALAIDTFTGLPTITPLTVTTIVNLPCLRVDVL
jgi:hypothetical protein